MISKQMVGEEASSRRQKAAKGTAPLIDLIVINRSEERDCSSGPNPTQPKLDLLTLLVVEWSIQIIVIQTQIM